MDRLRTELLRLFPDAEAPGVQRHTLTLVFRHSTDWSHLAAICQGMIDDLEWPSPIISVAGRDGYCLWLPLAEPLAEIEGRALLAGLCRHYCPTLKASRFDILPAHIDPVPQQQDEAGGWSAFIDPGMGEMFKEGGGLEMPPNPERQADLLASARALLPAEIARAFAQLAPASAAPEDNAVVSMCNPQLAAQDNPHDFLLAVMNDPAVPLAQRMAAARDLLPYFPPPVR